MKLTELNKIFGFGYGNKFDLNKMSLADAYDKAVLFVGRSGQHNGVTAYVSKVEDVEPYEAGLITVALGGAILSSFVQPKPFYTGQNIAVLTPPKGMSLAEKMFYCLCIQENRHRYGAFGREANRTLKNLMVPERSSVPSWVGTTHKTVSDEWTADLKVALQA
jgi:hypothetical protein